MKQRRWSGEEKMAIVLEGLKGVKSVADICREHKISQALYYRWKDKFLEGGKKALVNGQADDNAYKAETNRLQKIIGKQARHREGFLINHKTVRKIMKENGLLATQTVHKAKRKGSQRKPKAIRPKTDLGNRYDKIYHTINWLGISYSSA